MWIHGKPPTQSGTTKQINLKRRNKAQQPHCRMSRRPSLIQQHRGQRSLQHSERKGQILQVQMGGSRLQMGPDLPHPDTLPLRNSGKETTIHSSKEEHQKEAITTQ